MRLPAVLLTLVYVAALAVALRDPSEHLVAGAVVLTAVLARLALRPAARSAISHAVGGSAVRYGDSDPVAVVEDAAVPAVAPGTPA